MPDSYKISSSTLLTSLQLSLSKPLPSFRMDTSWRQFITEFMLILPQDVIRLPSFLLLLGRTDVYRLASALLGHQRSIVVSLVSQDHQTSS